MCWCWQKIFWNILRNAKLKNEMLYQTFSDLVAVKFSILGSVQVYGDVQDLWEEIGDVWHVHVFESRLTVNKQMHSWCEFPARLLTTIVLLIVSPSSSCRFKPCCFLSYAVKTFMTLTPVRCLFVRAVCWTSARRSGWRATVAGTARAARPSATPSSALSSGNCRQSSSLCWKGMWLLSNRISLGSTCTCIILGRFRL